MGVGSAMVVRGGVVVFGGGLCAGGVAGGGCAAMGALAVCGMVLSSHRCVAMTRAKRKFRSGG
eukprot:2496503-Pleurochrysis_carterae.AAC.1